jgi:hypothetical protein
MPAADRRYHVRRPRRAALFRQRAAEGRNAGAHHVHRVRRRRQRLQHRAHAGGQAAQRFETVFIGLQLVAVGQLAVDQQVGDLFKLAVAREVEDVVTTVVQIVAAAPYGTQRGIPGGHAG